MRIAARLLWLLPLGCLACHAQSTPPAGATETGELCTRLIGCYPYAAETTGQCFWDTVHWANGSADSPVIIYGISWALRSCLSAAKDCDAAEACLYPQNVPGKQALVCNPGADGDALCAAIAPGTVCLSLDSGETRCGVAKCTQVGSATCMGDQLQFCAGGVRQVEDCAASGMHCGNGPDGVAQCLGEGEACTDGATAQCSGDEAAFCQGGHVHRVECGTWAVHSTCGTHAECIPSPKLSCDPTSWQGKCDGTTLQYCDGSIETVDCRKLGFQSCTLDPVTGFPRCA